MTVPEAKALILDVAREQGYIRPCDIKVGRNASNGTSYRAFDELRDEGLLQRAAWGVYQVAGETRALPLDVQKGRPRKPRKETAAMYLDRLIASSPTPPVVLEPQRPARRVARGVARRELTAADHYTTEIATVDRGDVIADATPAKTTEERVIAALALDSRGLTVPELARAMYGLSKMDAELPRLYTVVDEMVGEMLIDEVDGVLTLPPAGIWD